ncbi:MAG: aldolase/citrate lyase family protein [Candidatus Latescibacterota bacterium]|jgi:4-hydroxy-2-oxoheptanedioate aldolase
MRPNQIRLTLQSGRPSLGAWLNLASPMAAEVMAAAGYEWLTLDAEHTAYDLPLIAHCFRAIEARGAVPLARAWDHDPVTLARLLDAGAYGLVIPHVSTPEQAARIAQAMRYAPRGSRSVGTGRCVVLGQDYRQRANDEILVIPQIEDMTGIRNAEAIARVEGVDIGFLGPSDLALSMGVEPGHPEHEAAIQAMRVAFARVGKPYGIPVRDPGPTRKRISEGFRFLDVASDVRLLELGGRQVLREATT